MMYATRLGTDIVAFLRSLDNASEWLDRVIRNGMAEHQKSLEIVL